MVDRILGFRDVHLHFRGYERLVSWRTTWSHTELSLVEPTPRRFTLVDDDAKQIRFQGKHLPHSTPPHALWSWSCFFSSSRPNPVPLRVQHIVHFAWSVHTIPFTRSEQRRRKEPRATCLELARRRTSRAGSCTAGQSRGEVVPVVGKTLAWLE